MNRMALIAITVTLLFTATAAHAVAPPSKSFLQRPVIVPIEVIRSGHIAIHAKINGKGPYRFIFDTGAPMLLISEEVAREAGVLPRHFDRPFFTPLGNLGDFVVNSIGLGRTAQLKITTNVWNHPTVELLSRSFGRFEGLIGYPFFAHYQVTIDYRAGTMTLLPSPYQPTNTAEKMQAAFSGQKPAKIWTACESLGIQVVKSPKDESAGVVVSTVMSNSPAADAGLTQGDRILTLDGRWTDTIDDCYAAVAGIETSRLVEVKLLRDGNPLIVQVAVRPGL